MRTLLVLTAVASVGAASPSPLVPWGANGHEMAARAAVASLPSAVPAFFRAAGDQLAYLNPEPDRWRVTGRDEMSRAWAPDHYINFENVTAEALEEPDRYAYLAALREAGTARPESAGLLPFAILERYQRLVLEWELWRREDDPDRRAWIEGRIIQDAGILGHFVADGSQPLHTTIHFNGWAEGRPNPAGFTDDRTLHARFETAFLDAHVHLADVRRRLREPRSLAGEVRPAVVDYLRGTLGQVEALYVLERDTGFAPSGPGSPEAVSFAADRLAAGAQMLADLWLSAWEESR
jgi:hypothetical protein